MKVLIVAIVAALTLAGCTASAGYATLDVDTWKVELEATPDAFLLDVRTPQEYQQARLANATLIPVQILSDNTDMLPEDKDTPIFVYCRSGNRSATASQELAELGYIQIYNLDGGINDWIQAGYPVVGG